MLGKVWKYEMKSLTRLFLPLFAGFLAVTLLCKFSFEAALARVVQTDILEIIAAVFTTLYVIYAIALFVMTAVFIVMHFYKTMAGNRGYLSHTLPVKTGTLINAKLLAAVVWPLIACVVLAFSFFIFSLGHVGLRDFGDFVRLMVQSFSQLFKELEQELSPYIHLPLLMAEVAICMVASLVSAPLMVYASIAVGQLFLKHRVLWSVLTYFVIYTVLQIATTLTLGVIGGGMVFSSHGADFSPQQITAVIRVYMLVALFFSVAPGIAYYVVTNYIFKKKLNLE